MSEPSRELTVTTATWAWGFLVDLPADIIHLSDSIGIENVCEIIDVTGWAQLRNWLCRECGGEHQNKEDDLKQFRVTRQNRSHAAHRKIIQSITAALQSRGPANLE